MNKATKSILLLTPVALLIVAGAAIGIMFAAGLIDLFKWVAAL